MKYYAVYFIGHYPVGAVAIVKAEDEQEAKEMTLEGLPTYLEHKNTIKSLEVIEITSDFTILFDGDH